MKRTEAGALLLATSLPEILDGLKLLYQTLKRQGEAELAQLVQDSFVAILTWATKPEVFENVGGPEDTDSETFLDGLPSRMSALVQYMQTSAAPPPIPDSPVASPNLPGFYL